MKLWRQSYRRIPVKPEVKETGEQMAYSLLNKLMLILALLYIIGITLGVF